MRRNATTHAPLSGKDLTGILIESFEKGGSVAVHRPSITGGPSSNPRVILAYRPDEPKTEYRIAVWPMQPGSGPLRESIRRFQIEPPFDPRIKEYSTQTLLLGYEPEMQMFVGFDPRRHLRYGSDELTYMYEANASLKQDFVEVKKTVLEEASKIGFWVEKAKNGELVVAIWPEMLPLYGKYARDIFKYASDEKTLRVLQDALRARGLPVPAAGQLKPGEGEFVLRLNKEYVSADFQVRVKRAYNFTCALSGMQLWLLDAAHILPAKHRESTNEVSNGIVLQPTLHRAMDTRVIYPKYLGPGRYEFRLNRDKACELVQPKKGGIDGLKLIEKFLDKRIPATRLPTEPDDQPSSVMIKEANRDREIRIEMIEDEEK